jgi:hypothetical protein
MAQCRHNHTPIKKADGWTKVAMVGEAAASFVSDGYWMGGIIDLAFSLEDDGLGLSWWGIGFGAGLSLVIAAGTAYSHTMLNIHHQDDEHAPQETSPLINDCNDHQHEHTHSDSGHEHNHDDDHHAHQPAESDGRLRFLQKLALAGDFVSHTGDIAGPLTFVSKMIAKDRLPIWGTVLVECGATLFGGVSSVANVRTCAKSMRVRNQQVDRELSAQQASTPSLSYQG